MLQPADWHNFHANVFPFSVAISPDDQKFGAPPLKIFNSQASHNVESQSKWQDLLLQRFLDQSTAVSLSKTLCHWCIKQRDGIAWVPESSCEIWKVQKTHHFLYCGANSILRRWPDREVITMSACRPWMIASAYILMKGSALVRKLPGPYTQTRRFYYRGWIPPSGWTPHYSWWRQYSWPRHSSRPHLRPSGLDQLV